MFISIIALVWLSGTFYRIYKQAHYFQIEEYQNGRYLRWVVAQRLRWLPNRPAVVVLVGLPATIMLSEAPGDLMFSIIGMVTALVAVWPPREAEVKKAFRPTPRAKRLLSASIVVAVINLTLFLIIFAPLPDLPQIQFGYITLAGFGLFLLAPIYLILGNLLMQPVEAAFRRRFVIQARQVLDNVRPTVIGITGSYGKTSTKSYLAHILNGRFRAYPTPKSYNTLMGVCLAINNDLAEDHSVDYFIAEMGAYVPGEIQQICDLTHPRISLVTEVGPQHLERFGSLENVAIAKYEIIKALPPDGVGIFNWDNLHVREMYERGYPKNRIAVSKIIDPNHVPSGGPRLVASNITEALTQTTFTVTDTQTGESTEFITLLLGLHNVTNLLLATAVAVNEGMSLKDVAWRVRDLQPAEARLVRQTTAAGITIINDAYSANPVGAEQSLRVLGMHTSGKRLLITPGMIELGPLMERENHRLGEIAAQYATDVILVGSQQTQPVQQGLKSAGFPVDKLRVVDTLDESVQWYETNLAAGDTVLFLNDLPDTYSS